MKLKQFLLQKVLYKNLLYMAGGALVFLLLVLLWLRIYTHHGQKIPVPDFTGLSMEEVAKVCEDQEFRYQLIDSVFVTTVPRGTVVEQNPKPGTQVKKNRNIFFITNAVVREKTSMPDLIGVSKRQAEAMLKSLGLVLGKKYYRTDLGIDNVLSQQYKGKKIMEGTLLYKGDTVDLVLGKGLSNKKNLVPELIGLYLQEAKDRINQASFNVGAVQYDNTCLTAEDSMKAFVWRQNPAYNGELELSLGSSLDIYVTVDSTLLPMDTLTVMNADSEIIDQAVKEVIEETATQTESNE